MPNICVYCGSNPGKLPDYAEAALALGNELLARNLGLVYGGGNVGLMGMIADAVMQGGGRVTGIIPHALAEKELAHQGLTELFVVNSMHQRKSKMADLADGFIAMPGGWGTMEEIFEALTWGQLGLHEKPCGLLNIAGYYDHLDAFLNHAMEERFVRKEYRPMVMVEESPGVLLDRFKGYKPPQVKKWIGPGET
jgi:uncharacterized protein (TIGR00730 family)